MENTTEDAFDALYRVHLKGVFFLCAIGKAGLQY
ncbi:MULTISPECIES: hypothetical protein [Nguyenibacter]|uniref:Uncharacterized protein n=1 Tax=Nguyenibacter vanlangensis TaxID=1216886 RepID=A0ABZ3DBG4_9PROT